MRNFLWRVRIIIVIIITTIISCQRNVETPNPIDPPIVDPLVEKVVSSIQGRITDENGKPVNDAVVKSGTNTTATDINGVFRFNNIQLAKNAGFVTVEKEGYLKGTRTIFTAANSLNYVEIQLIPRVERGNFTASAGGVVVIQNGSKVSFPTNAIINTATNTAYSGKVKVFGAYLDPTDALLPLIMPGNLTGITTKNEQKTLQTFGMLAIELEGEAGEKLNLASGKAATINIPIPASLSAQAPASIPLWFFDDTRGVWIEEGAASKTGNEYVGSVSHFTFWNWDVPANFIRLKMVLKNQNDQPLAGYRVELTIKANNAKSDGYTDSTGFITGAAPVNAVLQMKVYSVCKSVIHTQDIGPFNADKDLGTITVNISDITPVTINGTVINCSNEAVTLGFAEIKLDGLIYRASVNNTGNYSITINRCSNTSSNATISATDIQANEQGIETIVVPVTSGTFTAPTVKACGVNVEQYINYSINGRVYSFIPPDQVLEVYAGDTITTTSVTAYDPMGAINNTSFTFPSKSVGSTTLTSFHLGSASALYVPTGAPISATIAEYGNVGQYISGSINGNVKDSLSNSTFPMQGSFRVLRIN